MSITVVTFASRVTVPCVKQWFRSMFHWIFKVDLEQIAFESAQRLGYDGLKENISKLLYLFSKAMTRFVALSTGGKSLIYEVLPVLFSISII